MLRNQYNSPINVIAYIDEHEIKTKKQISLEEYIEKQSIEDYNDLIEKIKSTKPKKEFYQSKL